MNNNNKMEKKEKVVKQKTKRSVPEPSNDGMNTPVPDNTSSHVLLKARQPY
jgi:hypothetical protein